MKDLIIRKSKASDMNEVLSLIKELADYERSLDRVKMTVERLIKDGFSKPPLFKSLVVVYKKEICGYAFFYQGYSTWNGKTLYLEDIMISKKYRRRGFGQKLFNQVVEIAIQQKVTRVDWQVLSWNKPAIEFYKKNQSTFDAEWINGRLFDLDLKNFSKSNIDESI